MTRSCIRVCQYQSKERPNYHCPEPALPGKDYCIFHEREKDAAEFKRRVTEKFQNKDYDFTGYYFPQSTSFGGVTFERDAYFGEATFEGNANFEGATLKGNAYFRRATFKRDAYFGEVTFKGNAYFGEATFKGNADFYSMECRREVDFEDAKFKRPKDKEIAYRLSKTSYQRAGDYEKAGDCYYKEMVARRQGLKWRSKSFFRKLLDWVFWSTCGYGERPFWVFYWALGIICLCALLYCFIGHIEATSAGYSFGIGDAVYFSGITFVTLGFGGPWYPSPEHWIKFLVMAEAFSGAFFMALFVMTFGRRMMR